MPFSSNVRTDALVAAARHCCTCHRYKGVKVEVHHIVQEAESGDNTSANAIALCFDCHTDAGHYNPLHPRGTKFSPQELRQARDEWHRIVQTISLDIPRSDLLYCRYLVCESISSIREITEGDLPRFPIGHPHLVENDVIHFQRSYIRTYTTTTSTPGAQDSAPGTSPNVGPHVEAQRIDDGDHLRPLWAVYLAATNLTDSPIRIDWINGRRETGDGFQSRPFTLSDNRGADRRQLPEARLPSGATLLFSVATVLGPSKYIRTILISQVGKSGLNVIQNEEVLHKDISDSLRETLVVGPSFWPSSIDTSGGSQPIHSFDPSNVYVIDRDWRAGG